MHCALSPAWARRSGRPRRPVIPTPAGGVTEILSPEVAAMIGRLADQGIEVFVPLGAEGTLSVEGGALVIRSKLLSVTEEYRCIACGYRGEDSEHVCRGPCMSNN